MKASGRVFKYGDNVDTDVIIPARYLNSSDPAELATHCMEDIANELGFKKSSVSIAMKNLREKNHIVVSESGFITLTESGRAIAEEIYERHQFLSTWLTELGVDPAVATQDACKIEHVISRESFEAIKKHIHLSDTPA